MIPRRVPAARLRLLAAVATLSACATPRAPGEPAAEEIRFAPEEVPTSASDGLEGKNDAELLAIGTAAYGAGDFRRAAAALGRLADAFPASPHAAAALRDAGRAHQQLGEWRLALERFRALAAREGAPTSPELTFRLAECAYHLGELAEARDHLDGLVARQDLGAGDRVRALAQRGVVDLEDGRPDEAERSLRLALSVWEEASERERLDVYPAAQAQYYLGEVYRLRTEAVRLDPASSEEELLRDLEDKAQLLLSAQGHYLRAIRLGEPEWAVAAGYRIGELYEGLHREIDGAPLPPGLTEEEAALYRAELSDRIRVLVTKAIALYEQTLAAAQRAGVDNRFVEEAERSLARLRALLSP